FSLYLCPDSTDLHSFPTRRSSDLIISLAVCRVYSFFNFNYVGGRKMEIQTLSLGPLGTNCYIVSNQGDCVIIDPGGDAHILTKYVTDNALDVKAILLTHAHFDHIGAVDELRKHYEVDVYLHEAEESWLVDANLNRSAAFMGSSYHIETAKPEQILAEGPLTIGTITCEVVHTPGHSPGSVSFIF